jgi:hypothetical protein
MVPVSKNSAHERVIAFGDEFDQGLVRGLGLLGHVGGNVFDAGAAVAADFVVVGLHLDQIDDALEGFLEPMGSWTGTTLRPKVEVSDCMTRSKSARSRSMRVQMTTRGRASLSACSRPSG